jgi:hypothetical protein
LNYEFEERAAILEFDGGFPRLDAERLAKERPWDKDPTWGLPRAVQVEMFDVGAVREPPSKDALPPYLQRIREKYCKR